MVTKTFAKFGLADLIADDKGVEHLASEAPEIEAFGLEEVQFNPVLNDAVDSTWAWQGLSLT